MFAEFKKAIYFIFACSVAAGAVGVAFAGTSANVAACDGNECNKSVDLTPAQSNGLCEAGQLMVSWNRLRPSDYMVQCSCDCTEQMNSNWLVNVESGQVDGFYGRFVKSSFAHSATGKTEVPDRFAPVKLCKAPAIDAEKSSIFVLLHKRPDETVPPYCYEVLFVSKESDRTILQGDRGEISKDNQDYWIKTVSKKRRSALLSIVSRIRNAARD